MLQNDTILKVENLSVKFSNRGKFAGGKNEEILNDINFIVKKGDVLAIIGPNGAGKTTLFRALLNIIPYEGSVVWQKGVRIGYVPQRMEIETDIPLTIYEFLRLRGSDNFSFEKAKEAIKSVLLPVEILSAGLGEISVGQRQRVLVAWSLLGKPDILLFDEPTADIDIRGQESIYQLLYNLQDKFNLAIILISHELNIVYKYAEKVLCLNRGQVCFGTPKEVLSPEHIQELYGGERGFYQHLHHHHDLEEHNS
ncbi:MAG: zinc transport system ATP-binding protein [Parcubacteria group bacterium Athens0714_26]|nr:MAG: zinc transport system ATP-binding protein [Parcubacteria group bacterium Athens1014_26]TSD02959.1 MAG: zinc transport system ATP-binding protein [Parcubacteria group bacterium Athens0714_26]